MTERKTEELRDEGKNFNPDDYPWTSGKDILNQQGISLNDLLKQCNELKRIACTVDKEGNKTYYLPFIKRSLGTPKYTRQEYAYIPLPNNVVIFLDIIPQHGNQTDIDYSNFLRERVQEFKTLPSESKILELQNKAMKHSFCDNEKDSETQPEKKAIDIKAYDTLANNLCIQKDYFSYYKEVSCLYRLDVHRVPYLFLVPNLLKINRDLILNKPSDDNSQNLNKVSRVVPAFLVAYDLHYYKEGNPPYPHPDVHYSYTSCEVKFTITENEQKSSFIQLEVLFSATEIHQISDKLKDFFLEFSKRTFALKDSALEDEVGRLIETQSKMYYEATNKLPNRIEPAKIVELLDYIAENEYIVPHYTSLNGHKFAFFNFNKDDFIKRYYMVNLDEGSKQFHNIINEMYFASSNATLRKIYPFTEGSFFDAFIGKVRQAADGYHITITEAMSNLGIKNIDSKQIKHQGGAPSNNNDEKPIIEKIKTAYLKGKESRENWSEDEQIEYLFNIYYIAYSRDNEIRLNNLSPQEMAYIMNIMDKDKETAKGRAGSYVKSKIRSHKLGSRAEQLKNGETKILLFAN